MKELKPNIVLIMVDQMRWDCLGINGHPNVETPNLDMMAKQGYNFKNAYSAVPSCIAARAAILTGMSQKNHGRVGYRDGVIWNYKNTIASEFSSAGYHTQCIGKMHVYPERNLCGFHNIVLHDGYLDASRRRTKSSGTQFEQSDDYLKWLKEKEGHNVDINDIGIDKNSWVARSWVYKEQHHPTNWVVTESIDFLRRRDTTKPFFLNMSFVRPHSPLDPPEFYYNQYINEELEEPVIGDWVIDREDEDEGIDVNCIVGKLNKKAMKRTRAAYYGSITHIDHQIRRFLSALEEYDEINNTIILFVSDHGDMLGDHNYFRKSVPYEGSSKVPFIIYDPGNLIKGCKGRKFNEVVELRDIMPTLLDFCNINIPESVDGESLKNIIVENEYTWRDYIHGEHTYGIRSNHYITDGKYKYIWFSQSGEEQFFDLIKDPKEIRNCIKEEYLQSIIGKFRTALITELEFREEGYSDGKQLIPDVNPVQVLKHIDN